MDKLQKKMLSVIESRCHLLVEGASGAGKTYRIKQMLDKSNRSYKLINAVGLSNLDDLTQIIDSLRGRILVIDEIHNLPFKVQNALLTFLETNKLEYKNITYMTSTPIICIGITTNGEKLFKPFRNRFINIYVSLPDEDEKLKYIRKYIKCARISDREHIINAAISYRDLYQISTLANRLRSVPKAMNILQYDCNGLNESERQFLYALNRLNSRASIRTIASAMNIDTETAQNIERNLILKEFITISSKGREVTEKGQEYVDI